MKLLNPNGFFVNCILLPCAVVGALYAGCTFADDAKPTPLKKKEKAKKAAAESPSRALIKARKMEPRVARAVTIFDLGDDDEEKVITIIEFENKTIGIYAGYADEAQDQWIMIEQKNQALLYEALGRSK